MSANPNGNVESAVHVSLGAPLLASAIAVVLGLISVFQLSITVDEWRYVHDGVKWWYGGGAVWLVDFGTLPLPFWIQNAPGALFLRIMRGGLPGGIGIDFGRALSLEDQFTLLRFARVTNLLLSGPATIFAAWLLAYRWFGTRAAAAAALFCAIEPNLLAGYVLATADAIVLPFVLLATLAYSDYVQRPHPARLLAATLFFGLGVAFKVSALPTGLLLIGAVFLANLVSRLGGGRVADRRASVAIRSSLRFTFVDVPLLVLVGFVVAWATNGFLMGWLLDPSMPNKLPYKIAGALGYHGADSAKVVAQLQAVRIPAPLAVIRAQAGHSRWGHPMTFLGRSGIHGPWYYYPYVFAMKSHVVLLVAAALGLFSAGVRRSPLLAGAALLVALSCTMGIKGGPRYFLLLYILLAILGGAGVAAMLQTLGSRARVVAVSTFVVASLALTLGSLPDLLTHTNPLWGGDAEGYRFADANYDWGQGLDQAVRKATRKQLHPIVYWTTGDPFYGVAKDQETLRGHDPSALLGELRGKYTAVSVHWLFHSAAEAPALQPLVRALAALGPDGRLCRTYFYFDLRDPARHAVLTRFVDREMRPAGASSTEQARLGGLDQR